MQPTTSKFTFDEFMQDAWADYEYNMYLIISDLKALRRGVTADRERALELFQRGMMSNEDFAKVLYTLRHYELYLRHDVEALEVLRKYLTSYDAWLDEEEKE